MLQALKNILLPFSDFIYPSLCFVCEKHLRDGERRVCRECWSSFRAFNVGDPIWHELKNRFGQDGVVNDFLSCFYFEKDGRLQDVVHFLKYRGIHSMGVMLGREIGTRILQNKEFSTVDFLVPVPLHRLKERERGYNQSEMLCKGIREVTGIPMDTGLIRRMRYTKSQTQLNLEERRENVEGAFVVPLKRSSHVKGMTIILVDDVITTGATVIACARAFVNAGVKTVYAVSAAVAE